MSDDDKKRLLYLAFFFIFVALTLLAVTGHAESSINWLSIGQGDRRYCKQGGSCNLTNLTVVNTTVTNILVNGTVSAINLTQGGVPINNTFIKRDGTNSPTNGINWDYHSLGNVTTLGVQTIAGDQAAGDFITIRSSFESVDPVDLVFSMGVLTSGYVDVLSVLGTTHGVNFFGMNLTADALGAPLGQMLKLVGTGGATNHELWLDMQSINDAINISSPTGVTTLLLGNGINTITAGSNSLILGGKGTNNNENLELNLDNYLPNKIGISSTSGTTDIVFQSINMESTENVKAAKNITALKFYEEGTKLCKANGTDCGTNATNVNGTAISPLSVNTTNVTLAIGDIVIGGKNKSNADIFLGEVGNALFNQQKNNQNFTVAIQADNAAIHVDSNQRKVRIFNNGTQLSANDPAFLVDGRNIGYTAVMALVNDGAKNHTIFNFYNANPEASFRNIFNGARARGTVDSPSNLSAADQVFSFIGQAYIADAYRSTASIDFIVGTSPSATSYPQTITFQTAATGETTRQSRLEIDTNGDVVIPLDDEKLYFGTGQDASITYDAGGNLTIDSDEVGTGSIKMAGSMILFNSATAPAAASPGETYFDITAGVATACVYNGTAWLDMTGRGLTCA